MHLPFYLGWLLSRLFFTLLYRVRVRGRENIPKEGPFILATNHISYFDPPLVGCVIKRSVYFMAKEELFRHGMRLFFLAIHALPIRRGAVDRRALKMCADRLAQGFGLVIFPEGTRTKTGHMLPARPGLGMVAKTTGCPIVPGYISGSNRLWRCFLGQDRLSVTYGPPITSEEAAAFANDKSGWQGLSDEVLNRVRAIRDGNPG